MKKPIWKYGQRHVLEFVQVMAILGLLLALAAALLPIHLKSAALIEPVGLAESAINELMIESAFTGRWPESGALDVDMSKFTGSVRSFSTTEAGNISILLSSRYQEIDGRELVFNVGTLKSGGGFGFHSWHCGGVLAPAPYIVVQPLAGTVSPVFSRTLCGSPS